MNEINKKARQCSELRDYAIDIVCGDENTLVPDEVLEHFKTCRECSAYLEGLRSTITLLRKVDLKISPPPHLVSNIISAIEKEEKKAWNREWLVRLVESWEKGWSDFWKSFKPVLFHPAFASVTVLVLVAGFVFLLKDYFPHKEKPLREEVKTIAVPPQLPSPLPPSTLSAKKEVSEEETRKTQELPLSKMEQEVKAMESQAMKTEKKISSGKRKARTSLRGAERALDLISEPSMMGVDEAMKKTGPPSTPSKSIESPDFKNKPLGGGKTAEVVSEDLVVKEKKKGESAPGAIAEQGVPQIPSSIDSLKSAAPETEAVEGKSLQKHAGYDPYDDAKKAFSDGDFDKAISILSSIINGSFTSNTPLSHVYHLLAKSWKGKGKNQKAIIYYENLFARFPSYSNIEDAKWEGAEIYIQMGEKEKAIKLLESLLSSKKYSEKARKKIDSLK